MKIKTANLKVGYILTEDVIGKSLTPLVPKKTMITEQIIEVLREFAIEEVVAEQEESLQLSSDLNITGSDINNTTNIYQKHGQTELSLPFDKLYQEAVQGYKKDFKNWQAGAGIEVGSVRGYFLPLLQMLEEDYTNILNVHKLANIEDYFYHHSISVGLFSGIIAQRMGFEKGEYYQAALAGCLADIGMAKVSNYIFRKKGTLTDDEISEIHTHPINSLKMIQESSSLKSSTKLAILQHHERLDGSGYPFGENSKRIPMLSRIIAVADAYHASICDHLYKEKKSPIASIIELMEDYFGKFDIKVLEVLMSIVAKLSIGTKVLLSNNEKAEVIYMKSAAITRPIVKTTLDSKIIDLEKKRDLFIKEILK